MARIQRTAVVPYTARQMYDLVNDVDQYQHFLPWCRSSRVLERSDAHAIASIEMAKGPLHRSFTTENRLEPGRRIRIQLRDGPFRHLEGDWHFDPVEGGSRVSLDLEFEFAGFLLHRALGPVFSQIAATLVDSFCQRAHGLYERHES